MIGPRTIEAVKPSKTAPMEAVGLKIWAFLGEGIFVTQIGHLVRHRNYDDSQSNPSFIFDKL